MIELTAHLVCDRCSKTIMEMMNVDDAEEARGRLGESDWGCESEDGDDVCAACWKEYDAKQHSEQPQPVAAVDPSAATPGTPTPRD